MLEALNETEDVGQTIQMIDSTIIRAHHCAAGTKRVGRPMGKWFFSSGPAICENVSGFSDELLAKMEIRAS